MCLIGVMEAGAGTAKTGPGGKPTGPGGKPTGPGGKPSGPGGKPRGPGGKPSGPGGKPRGPGGKPRGPGGKPQPPVKPQRVTCYNRGSKCFLKYVTCPVECPKVQPKDGKSKGCFLDCYSPNVRLFAEVRIMLANFRRKPNCNGVGAACFDPRFIGGDGIMFYFHGRSNEHFSLVSDINLQINSRFIGLRPAGRTRDYTWIQALGLIRLYSEWTSPENNLKVERIASKNSATVTLSEAVEILVNVIPVTEEDNRIHNYQIPSNDSFAHLEAQFRFFNLSAQVEGVLGQTYQPNFHNTAKAGVAMPIVGGADKYRTSSILSADCKSCLFSPSNNVTGEGLLSMEYATLDCTGGLAAAME
ncbi:hypothetical protein CK203_075875 [Vitis vinifera]|uniref:Uncharacterized protein n=1 Tax=Vitis vinifera TaxID=29760 RepID=A0A438EF30_VITVI|nr:hypothetical protein CK203_075875 [Vitis vinifera]